MEIQCSSLKNETVIFIIPHTINTITIHVFKIISSIIPNYFQNSFNRNGCLSFVHLEIIHFLILYKSLDLSDFFIVILVTFHDYSPYRKFDGILGFQS